MEQMCRDVPLQVLLSFASCEMIDGREVDTPYSGYSGPRSRSELFKMHPM